TVYAGSVAGLYRSEDRGKSWYVVSDEGLVVNSIVVHPQRPGRIILGVEGDGVYLSTDNAKTFTRASDGLRNLHITTVVADPRVTNRVYAAVMNGGAASGIYRSDDAGTNWTKVSTTKLPEVLSLTIASERDADPRFVAGTEKGFFWSNDAVEWTQAAPVNAPIRVDKVIRFNRARLFAATSEGVLTSRDAGKTWYRLAGADARTVDIAVGALGPHPALFALSESGVRVYDGEGWNAIADAPTRGRTLAIRKVKDSQFVFIAGFHGVKAGRVDIDRIWHAADAPDAQYASVFGSSNQLFLTSRQQREVLVGDPQQADWLSLSLPSRNTEVTAIARDPNVADRFYVGTLGEGVYVYEGKAQKYVAKAAEETAATLGSK
ncbi:MAG TPA: hypothetical protein VJ276_12735, partial [Thermoanaerobaculia bacterium]|nr:hypothetical protein [Thermoanaerobaculia bacterium]